MSNRNHIKAVVISAAILIAAGPVRRAAGQCEWVIVPGVYNARVVLGVADDPFLAQGGPALYAAGYFSGAGGEPANNIAVWDGLSWSALGEGVSGARPMAIFQDQLYVGTGDHVARWDGSAWTVFAETDGPVEGAMAVFDGSLYVGGGFETIAGVPANGIARWDGVSWSDVGGGLEALKKNGSCCSAGSVKRHGMVVWNDGAGDMLVVSGGFTFAGGVAASHIAMWDGSAWSPLGDGLAGGGPVAVSGGELYAAHFWRASGNSHAWEVAKWNTMQWEVLGGPMDGIVRSLEGFDGSIYVGGYFEIMEGGDVVANKIAVWDDDLEVWTSAGDGCCGSTVWDLTLFDDDGAGPGEEVLYAVPGGQIRRLSCGPCTGDADCADGLFCNGAETCVDGACQPGVDPCPPDEICLEDSDTCCSPSVEVCDDDTDNDCDGLIDAADPDCGCLSKNTPCSFDQQCCSGFCKPNGKCQ